MCVSSLFNNTQQIVYGYSQNCRGATLFANIGEQELDTLVSCAELNVTQVGCDNWNIHTIILFIIDKENNKLLLRG